MAKIISITYTPSEIESHPQDRYGRVALGKAALLKNHGIRGDTKGRQGKRQLNVMRAETVAELHQEGFSTQPGELGEQIVIAGLAADSFIDGAQLQLGESAIIEITYLRTPCRRFERVQGRPKGLVRGRIGCMARVVQEGEIEIGARVSLVVKTHTNGACV